MPSDEDLQDVFEDDVRKRLRAPTARRSHRKRQITEMELLEMERAKLNYQREMMRVVMMEKERRRQQQAMKAQRQRRPPARRAPRTSLAR